MNVMAVINKARILKQNKYRKLHIIVYKNSKLKLETKLVLLVLTFKNIIIYYNMVNFIRICIWYILHGKIYKKKYDIILKSPSVLNHIFNTY